MLLMSSQRSFMPKKRKSYWIISEIAPPPLKVDAADDGWVGIWKAPLPDGTAELKNKWSHRLVSCVSWYNKIKCIWSDIKLDGEIEMYNSQILIFYYFGICLYNN